MKKVKCKSCSKVWYVDDEQLNNQKCCPYCKTDITKEVKFDDIDNFDKAIYITVKAVGIDILKTPSRLAAYMMDTFPNFKNEVRFMSKNITDKYANDIFKAFSDSTQDVEEIFIKIKQMLVDEDFISDKWADTICNGLKGASLMMRGQNVPVKLSVEVYDVLDVRENTSESYDYWELLEKLKKLKSKKNL